MKFKHLMMLAVAAILALAACGKSSDGQAALNNIFARRSVRSFTSQDVSHEQVETLLRAAMAAPSGMNMQPWRFVVVRDSTTKARLTKHGSEFIKTAPVVIVVCAELAEETDENQKPNQNWMADCAAATENLLLAAQAMGLGACWTACFPYFSIQTDAKRTLRLPENVRPYSIIPVGYPAGETQAKDKWKPENIHYEHWRRDADEEGSTPTTKLPVRSGRRAPLKKAN